MNVTGTRRELRDRSILITGGGGFIGSHIADAVAEHNDLTVVDDFSSGERSRIPAEASIIEGDIRDQQLLAEVMADVDIVFHEAANVSVEHSVANPLDSHSVSVDGTLAVLEQARKVDARVVVASSAAIYGHPESVPISESHPKTPTSPYGIDKLTVDHYTRRYHELYDLDTVALRYFNVYGPRQSAGDYSGVISIFMKQAKSNDPITIDGDGTQTRDFVHVDDVVRANLLAATTDKVGTAFNIGTGVETSINELAATVKQVTNSQSEIVHGEPRPGDIEFSAADISAAKGRLGFRPSTDLKTGLSSIT